jgi:hypothetical protein
MGWKEAINTYPSSIVYEIHGYHAITTLSNTNKFNYVPVLINVKIYPVYLKGSYLLQENLSCLQYTLVAGTPQHAQQQHFQPQP